MVHIYKIMDISYYPIIMQKPSLLQPGGKVVTRLASLWQPCNWSKQPCDNLVLLLKQVLYDCHLGQQPYDNLVLIT